MLSFQSVCFKFGLCLTRCYLGQMGLELAYSKASFLSSGAKLRCLASSTAAEILTAEQDFKLRRPNGSGSMMPKTSAATAAAETSHGAIALQPWSVVRQSTRDSRFFGGKVESFLIASFAQSFCSVMTSILAKALTLAPIFSPVDYNNPLPMRIAMKSGRVD